MITDRIKQLFNSVTKSEEMLNLLPYMLRKQWLEQQMLCCTDKGVTNTKYGDSEIIVSLTTYGTRIDYVGLTIESIMQQTMKANRIILWLYTDDYKKDMPEVLKRQQKRGLEIMEYKKDIRSYKKLIPTLKHFPDAAVITFDDDLLYDYDIIERLIKSHQRNPQYISACRTHLITLTEDGNVMPYSKWRHYSHETTNNDLLFATTGGGVLFPPHSLCDETINEDVFTAICPTADDIWVKAMILLSKAKIIKVPTKSNKGDEFIGIPEAQDNALYKINTGALQMNDKQLQAVMDKYHLHLNRE